ncbi:high mobility group box domain-containing protein [Xylaria nigripes]|nr:high mobility group box domain-containing protein [Xylaria nigripes]
MATFAAPNAAANAAYLTFVLENVSAQLDDFNTVVKLPKSVFDRLDIAGKEAVKNHIRSRAGYCSRIYMDTFKGGRVLIGSTPNFRPARASEPRIPSRREMPAVRHEAQTGSGDLNSVPPPQAQGFPAQHDQLPPGDAESLQVSFAPAIPQGNAPDQQQQPAPKRARNEKKRGPGPRNSFIIFRCQTSKALKQERPELSNGEISKILGQRWQALTPEQRTPYINLAKEEATRFKERETQDPADDE